MVTNADPFPHLPAVPPHAALREQYDLFRKVYLKLGDCVPDSTRPNPRWDDIPEKRREQFYNLCFHLGVRGCPISVPGIVDDLMANFRTHLQRLPRMVAILTPGVLNEGSLFELAGLVFDELEDLKAKGVLVTRLVDPVNRCVFCLTEQGPFTNVEHLLGESVVGLLLANAHVLGGRRLVLPQGWVCDGCQSGRQQGQGINGLEEALLKVQAIAVNIRTHRLPIVRKDGRPLPEFKVRGARLKTDRQGLHVVLGPDASAPEIQRALDGARSGRIRFTGLGPPGWKKVGRAVMKSIFGLRALTKGRDYVCSKTFDAARQFIVGESKAFANQLLVEYPKYDPKKPIEFGLSKVDDSFQLLIFGANFCGSLAEGSLPIFAAHDPRRARVVDLSTGLLHRCPVGSSPRT